MSNEYDRQEPILFSAAVIANLIGEDAVIVILQEFLLSLVPTRDELSIAFKQQNKAQTMMLCHRLKSSTRFVGAEHSANLLEQIELACKNGQDVPLVTQTQLLNTLEQLEQAIRVYIKQQEIQQ